MKLKIPLYNRQTKKIENECIFEVSFMTFVYDTYFGSLLEKLIFKRIWFSKIYGKIQKSERSKHKITEFIKKYKIDISELDQSLEEYSNFNAFFIRKFKPNIRSINTEPKKLISPCDARLMVYPISNASDIKIKQNLYSVEQLLLSKKSAKEYSEGVCLVYRLAPMDYHRFVYFDDGQESELVNVNGYLHSVSPIAQKKITRVFSENVRQYSVLKTRNFGHVIQIDVGAMVVGKIKQHKITGGDFMRGEEKGYFEFGGSTIVLLFKKECIKVDKDIAEQSLENIETLVKMGEVVGQIY
ncbi:phosphatidylserine decarboxylase [Pseudoalteromonas denitrificans]|uniref:Phosphatidylserine decarboxylase n=1 Tax=Pseudoalteromonas denitrificans DSM 6059 TaxID=1123010 RepID=A0A1I1QY54_9GAMM|nr:phosphatidylserine decarboxylase [Pseudoalteromonas denitrificans]SFD27036.1 phosphatidylserine decarboxylase [Pseudoalteromonas denitrificans DSM 6059]